MILYNVNLIIPEGSERPKVRFNKKQIWTNKAGKAWQFQADWESDFHSIPGGVQTIDRLSMAALCHDQDCEVANKLNDYAMRVQGDKDYYQNMRDLGGSRFIAGRRYAAVRLRSLKLKAQGKLK